MSGTAKPTMDASDRRGQQGSEPAARSRSPGPPAAAAMPLVTLEPARACRVCPWFLLPSNTAAVRTASGEALAAMQRGTVVIKIPAVGALAAGAGVLINHLPDELLAEVFCYVDAKTLFVAVPSVSLAGGHCVWVWWGWGGSVTQEGDLWIC